MNKKNLSIKMLPSVGKMVKSVRKSEYFPLVGPTTLAYPEK